MRTEAEYIDALRRSDEIRYGDVAGHQSAFKDSDEQRGCPACKGVPHGQAWLCRICKGEQLVPHWVAVAYCDALVVQRQAALGRAHGKLKVALFGREC